MKIDKIENSSKKVSQAQLNKLVDYKKEYELLLNDYNKVTRKQYMYAHADLKEKMLANKYHLNKTNLSFEQ